MVALATPEQHRKSGKRRGFPDEYRKLTLTEKLEWLASEDAESRVRCGAIQQSQVCADERRINKELRRVRPTVPTPNRLHEHATGYPFPPLADNPRCQMRRARRVLNPIELPVLWPADYIQAGRTYDVVCKETEDRRGRLHLDSGSLRDKYERISSSSPTAFALLSLSDRHGVIEDRALPTEDPRILQHQINQHLAGKSDAIFANDF